jgi:hypothetical protein
MNPGPTGEKSYYARNLLHSINLHHYSMNCPFGVGEVGLDAASGVVRL